MQVLATNVAEMTDVTHCALIVPNCMDCLNIATNKINFHNFITISILYLYQRRYDRIDFCMHA